MKAEIHEIRLGSVYRFAVKRRLAKDRATDLLEARTSLSKQASQQLASHWYSTEKLRQRALSTEPEKQP